MREAVVKVFKFEELSDEVKKRVLNKLRDINTENEWWDWISCDAADIKMYLEEFDIWDRHIIMGFKQSAKETADAIIQNHGEHCETYKIAQGFLSVYHENLNEDQMEELQDDFREELSKVYLDMLKKEYLFMTSDKAIIETIEQTGIEFLPDGREFME